VSVGVTTRLIGGLGNQMFQYAAGRALALRQGAPLELDISGFASYPLRRYELDAFTLDAGLCLSGAKASPVAGFAAAARRWFGRKPAAAMRVYREPHFQFDENLARQRAPVIIDGYWQSERYFADAVDAIRAEFTPRAPLEPSNRAVAEEIRSATNPVSLHVRRGDYVSNPETSAVHGVCPPAYYEASVKLLKDRLGPLTLYVFSDDQAWTRQNMHFDVPTVHVGANPPDRGFRDMQLMAMCKHHVIANSSFSWWGAWLNPARDKTVIAPARWFADGTRDTADLLPSSWITL
jgi:hypothetical protein